MSLRPGDRLGPYEVLGLIGAGEMGEVSKARDTRLDRVAAIKVCPSDTPIASNIDLRGEGTVQVLDVGLATAITSLAAQGPR